jgi:hypothetical protein
VRRVTRVLLSPQQWDPTNFLVDLSCHYANCESVGRRGAVTVDRLTTEGASITGAVDWTEGTRSDVDAVNEYIRTVVDRWVNTRLFHTQVRSLAAYNVVFVLTAALGAM